MITRQWKQVWHQNIKNKYLYDKNEENEIPDFQNIYVSLSNFLSDPNNCKFKELLLISLNILENYYSKINYNNFKENHNQLFPLMIEIFSVFGDETILLAFLRCFCYIINFLDDIKPFCDEEFLSKIFNLTIYENIHICDPAQYFFAKLLSFSEIRHLKSTLFWLEKLEIIDNKTQNINFKKYKSMSLNELVQDNIYLNLISNIVYSSLNMLDSPEYCCISLDTIITCIKKTVNTEILSQIQNVFQPFLSTLVQLTNEIICVIGLCKLYTICLKKGILDYHFIIDNNIENIMLNHLETTTLKPVENIQNDNIAAEIINFFSELLVLFKFGFEYDFVLKLLNMTVDGSLSIRKASVLLVCQLIEHELIDVTNYFTDFTFFKILGDIIITQPLEIIEPLLECFATLLTMNESFLNFLVTPQYYDELEELVKSLLDIAETEVNNNEHVCELVDDIIFDIKKELPKI